MLQLNRASAVYVVMAMILVAGLWVILSLGATLRAPADFAGEWLLVRSGEEKPETKMLIQQSGRHLTLSGIDGKMYRMKMIESGYESGQVRVHLEGDGAEATLKGPERGDRFKFTLSNPQPREWTAIEIARTYPRTERASSQTPTTQHARLD